ncbi:N6-adenosine-specific RNA methylase IME4 [Roseomonas rosea]|uniref:N6-adenosine-specific RNA methylase IME4 n=1 Tax=Muricoccus roseus TaxID=198092 RepID=A0A1M6LAU3_9PROT|nr:MT-A70 family methyltransferase [Roseomonas rosea]SHJ68294.1 N6-adenosine-specific RNA methylase IME4 [Roseomonas rosea]
MTPYTPDLLHGLRNWPFGDLRSGYYRTILADPPWRFVLRSTKGEKKSPQAKYRTMPLAEILALPVVELAHPEGCGLVLWGTAPMLPQALATMAAWGFTYVTAGAWAKQSRTGRTWNMGPGYRLRTRMEPYLLGTRGAVPLMARNVCNLVVAPVREHSRKPDQLRADVERVFPAPRVELFAREAAPGWEAWGDEVGKFSPAGAVPC